MLRGTERQGPKNTSDLRSELLYPRTSLQYAEMQESRWTTYMSTAACPLMVSMLPMFQILKADGYENLQYCAHNH